MGGGGISDRSKPTLSIPASLCAVSLCYHNWECFKCNGILITSKA